MGKCDRTKGYELGVVQYRELSKACLFRFLGIPLSLDSPYLRRQEGHLSQENLMTCFKEEVGVGRSQRVLPTLAISLIPPA